MDASLRVAGTRKRREKTIILTDVVGAMDPRERAVGVAYLSGTLPQGKLGVGYNVLSGLRDKAGQEDRGLALLEVDQTMSDLKAERGPGSVKRKVAALQQLFERLGPAEAAFLERLLLGEIRQGALESLVTDAVAAASGVEAEKLRRAVMFAGSLIEVTPVAFTTGEKGLSQYGVELFRPIKPMLANSASDPADALSNFCPAIAETKMDGARIQVHRSGERVRVFSRNLRDVTVAVPEVTEAVMELSVNELLLEGEVLALAEDHRPLPFQTTMRRFGRKLDVDGLRQHIPLSPFFFDLLYLDGEPFMDLPLELRLQKLHELISPANQLVRERVHEPAALESFYDKTLAAGHEGVMVKDPQAPYQAGKRGSAWLKLKPAHTLDLAVIAVEWGSGRRTGLLSNLHLGARDGDGFAPVGKTFKGLTDDMLRFQTERLLALETGRENHVVYVRPELVVEIAFSDVQQSSNYRSGCALRFARVRSYRLDKSSHDVDTLETVQGMLPR